MESIHSGSMPSSSGGDDHEEHDSRTNHQSISPFLNLHNHNLQTHFPISSNSQPPSSINHYHHHHHHQNHNHNHNHHHQPTTLFDDSNTNFYSPFSQSNLQPNPMSSDHEPGLNMTHPFPTSSTSYNHRAPENVAATKKPKKRTRASRRAPTTVLTTDTSNFRAMVQEFTGIPGGPPVFSQPPYSRGGVGSQFDLFGSGSKFGANGTQMDPIIGGPFNYGSTQKDNFGHRDHDNRN